MQAKVCYASVCTNSAPVDVIVGAAPLMQSQTILTVEEPGSGYCESYITVYVAAVIANWTPELPVPTGTVDFFDNGNPLGSQEGWDGNLAYLQAPLDVFVEHIITASYSGDGNWLPATSAPRLFPACISSY